MTFQIRKAERKQAKLRIGLFGPSGSGKTMSSLKLARGITDWDKICIIDTENRSADLYSKLGDYNVINIDAPYTPEKYIEAMQAALDGGMEVIIIDSITHEWAGKGGILELSDELAKAAKNSFMVWGKLTPRHNAFIEAITSCPVDIICCGRSKQEYVINQQERNGKMINVPEKVGLKAVTREGFDYEMTTSFEIAINHYATTSKDRTGVFMDKPEFVINEDVGKIIKEWNASVAPDVIEQKREIMRQLKRLGVPTVKAEEIKSGVKFITDLELVDANFGAVIAKLRLIKAGQVQLPQPPVAPAVQSETKTAQPTPPGQPLPGTLETPHTNHPADDGQPNHGDAGPVKQPAKTPEGIKAEAKEARAKAPKPSEGKLNLIKALMEQKENIKRDDEPNQLGYLMFIQNIEIDNFLELTLEEADRVYHMLLAKKSEQQPTQ